jgi:hypothetical protein
LEQLDRLEQDGRHFHLIAHSHGGSVVWEALRLSTRRTEPLKGLSSWTTVATPFLGFSPRPSPAWLLFPILYSGALSLVLGRAAASYSSSPGDLSDGERLALTTLPGGAAAVAAFILVVMLSQFSRWLLAIKVHNDDLRAAQKAMSWYGDRWLDVYASVDEAINGLRSTAGFQTQILPRIETARGREGRLKMALLWPFRVLHRTFLTHPYDRVLAPAVDAFVSHRLAEGAQGNDLPALELTSVSPWPAGCLPFNPLPSTIEVSLRERVRQANAELVEALRGALAQVRAGGDSVQQVRSLLVVQPEALVHTAYFDSAEVREVLALWVLGRSLSRAADSGWQEKAPGPSAWLSEAVHSFAERRASHVWETTRDRIRDAILGIPAEGLNTPAEREQALLNARVNRRFWVNSAAFLAIVGGFWLFVLPAGLTSEYREIMLAWFSDGPKSGYQEIILNTKGKKLYWTCTIIAALLACIWTVILVASRIRVWRKQGLAQSPAHPSIPPTLETPTGDRPARSIIVSELIDVGLIAVLVLAAYVGLGPSLLRWLASEDNAGRCLAAGLVLLASAIVILLAMSKRPRLAGYKPAFIVDRPTELRGATRQLISLYVMPVAALWVYGTLMLLARDSNPEYQITRMVRSAPQPQSGPARRDWLSALARRRLYS